MTLLATCPDCRKKYRVPHAEKEWRCKVCDLPLELEEPEEPEEDAPECPECGTEVVGDASFCEECGAALEAEAPPRSKAEQKVAAAKMRKAMGRVRILRFFLYLAMLGAVFQLLAVVLVAWTGLVPLAPGVLALTISGANVGLVLLAFHYLERRPFPVTLTLALLATLSAAIEFLTDELSPVSVVWAVFCWITTIFAAQVTRLAREYPDLYLSRKMSGKNPRRSGGARSRKIQENWQRKQRRKLIITSTVFGLLTLLGFAGLFVSGSPEQLLTEAELPSPADTLREFKDAWNEADLERLAELAPEEYREKRLSSLNKAMRTYDWGTELPTITAYNSRPPAGNRMETVFSTVGGDLKAVFLWDGERWTSSSLNFKGVKSWRP